MLVVSFADAHRGLNTMKASSVKTKSAMDEDSSSDESQTNSFDDQMDSDIDDEEMDKEDEEMDKGDDVSDSDTEDEVIRGNFKEGKVKNSSSDSSDEDGTRTMEDGDGVEFSDGDDNDLEDDEGVDTAEGTEGNDTKVAANPAWAQAMAKILRTQKPAGKKSVVLSKARTIQAAESAAVNKEEEPDFEIVGEKEGKPKIKSEDIKPTAEELHEAVSIDEHALNILCIHQVCLIQHEQIFIFLL